MEWLSKTDPNYVWLGLTVLSSLGGWLWHQIRGDKKQSFGSLLDAIILNLMHEQLDQYKGQDLASYLNTARDAVEENIWAIASKRGIPRNGLTEQLLHGAMERGTLWLGNEIAVRQLPGKLVELEKQLQNAADEFKK